MKHTIRHRLRFDPGIGNAHAVQHVLLAPLSGPTQRVHDWTLELDGMETAAGFIDAFGNRAYLVSQTRPEGLLELVATGTVETHDHHGVVGRQTADPMPALYRRRTAKTLPIADLVQPLAGASREGRDRIGLLHTLMAAVGVHFAEAGSQAQSQAGQSQGQANEPQVSPEVLTHAFLGAARALDIPARYVTGYLTDAEHKTSSLHAWAEAYDEGLGWIGFDCLLNLCPTSLHVRIASGLDADSTAPVRRYPVTGDVETVELVVSGQA